MWTFAVLAGAIWAEDSWGRYWGWDPKETWAFITWVLYAAYLHAQSTAGWRGTKAGWLALAGYAAFLFNFVGVNLLITGLHSYAGVRGATTTPPLRDGSGWRSSGAPHQQGP